MKIDKRIQNIEHDIDGWWIYLKPGFVVSDEGTHAIVETRAELNNAGIALRDWLEFHRARRALLSCSRAPCGEIGR